MFTFGSLFAGIGGFDLGLERAGMSCQWQVEIEDYPTKILEKHWPEVHRERDIKECSGENLEPVDLICGGFPCQDISVAGKGAGLAGERSGLWYEMHRIIGDIKPRWVVVENVAALLHRGMDVVLRDLSAIGYDCEWHIISASAVGAPHRRERVWIIANSHCINDAMRRNNTPDAEAMAGRDSNARGGKRDSPEGCTEGTGEGSCDAPNANGVGRAKERQRKSGKGSAARTEVQLPNEGEEQRETQGAIPDTNSKRLEGKRRKNKTQRRQNKDGSLGLCNREELRRHESWWKAESGIQPLVNGVPERMARLKAIGNAVVPQIVELIGRRIMEIEGQLN